MLDSIYDVAMTISIIIVTAAIAAGIIVTIREWSWRNWAKAHNRESWLLDVLLVTNVIQDVVGVWFMFWATMRLLTGHVAPIWTVPITITLIGILFAKKAWRHRMVMKHADKELQALLQNGRPQ